MIYLDSNSAESAERWRNTDTGDTDYPTEEAARAAGSLTFTLTITLGNDGMQDGGDIAEALEWVADHTDIMGSRKGSIRDRNGNTVGSWAVK